MPGPMGTVFQTRWIPGVVASLPTVKGLGGDVKIPPKIEMNPCVRVECGYDFGEGKFIERCEGQAPTACGCRQSPFQCLSIFSNCFGLLVLIMASS